MLAHRDEHFYVPAMKFTVTIGRDETGMLVAQCPAISGCVSQGRTKLDALKNLRETIVSRSARGAYSLPLSSSK